MDYSIDYVNIRCFMKLEGKSGVRKFHIRVYLESTVFSLFKVTSVLENISK